MKRALVRELFALGLRPVAEVVGLDSKTYGAAAETGVRKFQAKKNLDVDGVVGEKTWRALGIDEPVVDAGVATNGGRVTASVEPRSSIRKGLGAGVAVGTLAVAITLCTLLASSAAYANTSHVELVNVATHLRADVMWASQADGQNVFLWVNNTSTSQLFDLIYTGSSRSGIRFFQIRARHSGKCLMLDKSQPTVGNGTRIAQYPCTSISYRSAQWYFKDMNPPCDDNALCVDRGWRVIKNLYTSKCIDTDNPAGTNPPQRAVLQLWTCISSTSAWNADNQIWKIWDPFARRTIYRPV
jgi:Ricin-type beta-trefoil lectin domain-like/Putative peptidoglycan binding domain